MTMYHPGNYDWEAVLVQTPTGIKPTPVRLLRPGCRVWAIEGLVTVVSNVEYIPERSVRVDLSDGGCILSFATTPNVKAPTGEWPIPEALPFPRYPKPLQVHPYLLGFLLGDGGMSGGSEVRVSKGDDLITHLSPFMPKGCRIIHLNGPDYAIRGDGQYNEILVSFRRYGLMGHKSDTKFVPHRYLYGTIQTRLDVLAGLIDSDGTATKTGHLEFTTGSAQLANDCAFLVRSLGGLIHETTRMTASGKIGWRMPIWLPEEYINPLRLPRKRERRELYKPKILKRKIVSGRVGRVENQNTLCHVVITDPPARLINATGFPMTQCI